VCTAAHIQGDTVTSDLPNLGGQTEQERQANYANSGTANLGITIAATLLFKFGNESGPAITTRI
jgi:hypothetical protein